MVRHRFTSQALLACTLVLVAVPVNAQNLIVNGDFESGNTGFSSAYTFVVSNTAVKEYGIVTDPIAWNPFFSVSYPDHTPGGVNMLVANGDTGGGVVWSQTVSVLPGGTYNFSGWASPAYFANKATLAFFVNGVSIGSLPLSATSEGTWTLFSASWSSGASTSAVLTITDLVLASDGNDFTLDDLSFTAVAAPEPGVLALMSILLPAGYLTRRRFSQR